ncbi:MAG: hypothetical protein MUF49_02460 [Oculatellaceae cyanobacterium Prado106]|nr:hypothetical protein [Oculatellaceae cyanobacterium Prado106]
MEELRYTFNTEYQLRKDRGELTGEAAPVFGKTKLEIKRIPYRRKQVTRIYTYVYVLHRRQNTQHCLGRLFQTHDSHEYDYRLLDNGGIVFSEREVFKLTRVHHPEQVMFIRLLKLEAPPFDYNIPSDGRLNLQVPLLYEVLHPETYHPQSQKQVDFPHCFTDGIFKRRWWQVETFAPHQATEPEATLMPPLTIPAQHSQQLIETLTRWQQLSQFVFPQQFWCLTVHTNDYQLIHSDGQPLLKYCTRDRQLYGLQASLQLAQYFQQFGNALLHHPHMQAREEGARLVTRMYSQIAQQETSTPHQEQPTNLVLQLLLEASSTFGKR